MLFRSVGANRSLRARLDAAVQRRGAKVFYPRIEFCTDNAAMIASAARYTDPIAFPGYLGRDAYATAS